MFGEELPLPIQHMDDAQFTQMLTKLDNIFDAIVALGNTVASVIRTPFTEPAHAVVIANSLEFPEITVVGI